MKSLGITNNIYCRRSTKKVLRDSYVVTYKLSAQNKFIKHILEGEAAKLKGKYDIMLYVQISDKNSQRIIEEGGEKWIYDEF